MGAQIGSREPTGARGVINGGKAIWGERFSKLVRVAAERVRAAARDPVTLTLLLILAFGAVLRMYFMLQWRPALIGFPDTGIYVIAANGDPFALPLRADGYAFFLEFLHAIYAHLAFVIAVQHVLGLASGLLLFGAMRQAGLARGLGLVPAAVVILGGSELFLEHAPLTEALFIFLVAAALYCAFRAWNGQILWAATTGLALGLAVDVRTVGLVLLVVFAIVFTLAAAGAWLNRITRTGVLVAVALAPVFAYLGGHAADGYGFNFTQNGYYDLYARIAPFADCSKFTPPKGTSQFCIHVPPRQRPGHDYWEFTPLSPAVQYYHESPEFQHNVPRDENSKLFSFSLAAIIGQPGDYLTLVARDSLRLIDPNYLPEPRPSGLAGYGNTPDSQLAYYFRTDNDRSLIPVLATYYPRVAQGAVHKDMSFLKDWDRATRIEGPVMAIFLALALLAPVLTSGSARRATFLFGATALVLLFGPIVVSEYDWRFVIPALGPLACTAAIGAWAVFERSRPLVARLRGRGPALP